MSHHPSERHSSDCKHPDTNTTAGAVGRIDEIDQLLLRLLAERGNIAFELATTQVASEGGPLSSKLDYDRLQKLDEFWRNHITSRFPLPGAQQVLKNVFSICASIVAPRRIAYLGPPGTFSHMALLQEFGSSPVQIECSTIAAVFAAVERDDAEYGVVPMENSIEGSITHTHDSFLRTRLMICGEFVLDVRLCLVAKDLDLSKIELVYSHPQPLAQCRTWLSTHLPRAETVACSSTTAAAQMAATNPKAAAVTSRLGAQLNELGILAQGIEDIAGNATRFVVIATNDSPRTGRDKTSVVFSTPDERGALLRVLSIFDAENLNLTRIESRPDKSRRWEYVFFTDVEGHRTDDALNRAIKRIQSQCQMVQILGSYPKALQSSECVP
jgi:chorismate mutase/prephenate dehydratase